jgi:hypothetical protein
LGDRTTGFSQEQLRPLLVVGVWHGLSARLAADTWRTDDRALHAVASRVDSEVVETAWETIHRGVTVRTPTVTDDQLVARQVTVGQNWTPRR